VTARRDPVALKNVLPIVPVLLLIPTGPLVAAWLERIPASPSVSLTLPSGVGGWEGPLPVQRPLGAQYHGADAQVAGEYRQDGRAVQLYVAYYARQRQGAELISSNNSVFDGAIWHATDGYQTRIVLADGKERPAHAMLLRSGGARRLVWQWYMVGDRVTASPIQVKLYEMQSRLSGANPGSAVVILAADFDTDAGQAQDTLRQFSAAILPAVQVMLGVAQ
jgi:EpsI family protein